MDYSEYINSRAWIDLRVQALARDGFRCRLCNSDDDLEVHHRSYADGYGTETVDDLTTLCKGCHTLTTVALRSRKAGREDASRVDAAIPETTLPRRDRKPTHPGAIIKEQLEALRLAPHTAAPLLGVTKTALGNVINQYSAVSPEMAVRLGIFFDTGPEIWSDLQIDYDLWAAQQRMGTALDKIKPAKKSAA